MFLQGTGIFCSHSQTSVVFPYPAGAQSSIKRFSIESPAFINSKMDWRCMICGCSDGIYSLVASSVSGKIFSESISSCFHTTAWFHFRLISDAERNCRMYDKISNGRMSQHQEWTIITENLWDPQRASSSSNSHYNERQRHSPWSIESLAESLNG